MFLTARIPWKQLAAILTLTAAFALCLLAGGGETSPASAPVPTDEEICRDYLEELGWVLDRKIASEQIRLPDPFGPEFEDYLALQREGGFDLEAYAGKTITRVSFSVTNYPTGEEGILADVLLLDGTVVGGELRSSALDGFMTALKSPEEAG